MIGTLLSVSYPIPIILQEALIYIFNTKKRGEDSLHPRPEGQHIRDPLSSRSNKEMGFIVQHHEQAWQIFPPLLLSIPLTLYLCHSFSVNDGFPLVCVSS